jgi:hydrogenase maturation protease
VSQTPQRWRVIGIGSPTVGDDLGWQVVEALQRQIDSPHAAVEWLLLDRPGAALMGYMTDVDGVILFDSLLAPLPATIRRLRLNQLDDTIGRSSHGVGVAVTLQLAAQLGLLPRWWRLFGVVAPFDAQGTALTAVAQRLRRLWVCERWHD